MPLASRDLDILNGVHPDLKRVFERVGQRFPCKILEGMRTEERQRELYAQEKTRTLNSKHLVGRAIDAAPLKLGAIDWNDIKLFAYFAGYVLGVAEEMGVKMTHGVDWDRDFDLTDTKFFDWPHFEVTD